MFRPSEQRVAQISIGVLLIVIVRSLGEYFRLQYLYGSALVIEQVTPYVGGALFAAVALVLTLGCFLAGLYRVSIAIAATALILLFTYKIAMVAIAAG